jgi:mono/diheme cytochrome c family protein
MKAATLLLALACATILGACGSQGVSIPKSSNYYRGAVLFRDHCSGCHTLSSVGAQGSATSIANRVPTNGPNFNIRKENAEQVLYAIRNGGFSGAIMPQNIVVGKEAQEVADFLAAYSGTKRQTVPNVNITQPGAGEAGKGGSGSEAAKQEPSGVPATPGNTGTTTQPANTTNTGTTGK